MKKSLIVSSFMSLFVILVLLCSPVSLASADGGGGGGPDRLITAAAGAGKSLGPAANEYGKIKLSVDALGITENQGIIHVAKPGGATVRKAYLLAATTGYTGYTLANGDVKLNGNDISWGQQISSSIASHNYWADVTNIVKSTIDGAPAGTVGIQVSEQNSALIDGEILAVIFDDPSQVTSSSIILYFGAQNIAGDTFTINTGKPININDPSLKLNFSLGISYGCHGDNYCAGGVGAQYSQVDVNGQRLTTAAGGSDDGELQNGALITVGGIGDSETNPASPYALPTSIRSDDELYNLKPFVKNNDTTIRINTRNPSNDDNIFFAALMLSSRNTIQTIDIDISLVGNPTTTEEKAPYENIIRNFADAVFEESNGINKLGTVTFYRNGDFADQAHVVWGSKGGPSSQVAGYGTPGKHINMYDIFEKGGFLGFDYNYLSDAEHQKAGGYTLGHEFGHLYYSLYDEYKCTASTTDCAEWDKLSWRPHSTDITVDHSIMNQQWNALGLFGDDYNWLNFSIAKNTSGDTAQYRVYGASGWDTLARPVSQDPQALQCSIFPVRLYHSELASVKPAPNADSRIDLPGTARSELHIVWADVLIASPDAAQAASATGVPYTAELNSMVGQNISYPDPILLEAFVHQDLNITDLNVAGNLTLPDGSTQTVQFADDGIAPDALAGDGRYSAILNYAMNGLYTVDVTFDNHSLTGKLVAYGLQMSTAITGDSMPYPDPQPVTDDFQLSRSLLISVSNVVADDHGNTPNLATPVFSDNVPVPGKMEYAGDADVFKITTSFADYTFIRVANLAFGITPHMRVLAADGQTVLYEVDLPSAEEGNYLNVALTNVSPGTTIYAEITDNLGNAGGLYKLSAGTAIASDTANHVHVKIGSIPQGQHIVPSRGSTRQSYQGVNSGPVEILNTKGAPMIAAERVIYKINGVNTSFSEMMGLPASQVELIYWLPWYNNVDLDTQLRFANVGTAVATVHVYIGAAEMEGSPFVLDPGTSTRQSFARVNSGPVKIVSDGPIVAAQRVIYKVQGVPTSFSEMMAFPNAQLDTSYWLPWYNNVDLDTQLRIGNVSGTPAIVNVYIGGMLSTPNAIVLPPGQSTRVSFPGVNNGPVNIVSDVPIVAAERVIYKVKGVNTSFSEMMALSNAQLDYAYWLPWYNNKDLDTQLRFANASNSDAWVHVYLGGQEAVGSPFFLGVGQSTRQSFVGINNGPVQIVSDVPIIVAERVIYKVNGVNTSFSEMMALPHAHLDTLYWLPWYNNVDLDTQLRFGVP